MRAEVTMFEHGSRRWVGAIFILVAACSDGGPAADEPQISGTVVDAETRAPLAGVLISTTPATERVTTGPDGTYLLLKDVRFASLFQVMATRDGYETQTRTITPSAIEANVLDIDLSILKVCTPAQTRCAQGAAPAVELCSARGNLWEPTPCPANNTCDPSTVTCVAAQRLTVTSSPNGAVISNPSGINCGSSCSADFPTGTQVLLEARSLAGGEFTGWGGDCASSGTTPTCTVTMNGAVNVSATFVSNIFGLTVRKMGRGAGSVSSAPAGISCGNTCSAPFDRDAMVTLTAAPANGSTFQRWQGDCTGTTPTCMVTMTQARSVTAFFAVPSFPLTVTKAGTGAGGVSSNPAGIDCGSTCDGDFDIGAMVTLTAGADTGSDFIGWTGDCTGASATCMVTMDQARNVTATFDGLAYPLSVTKNGQGTGAITSAPTGIDCGADCSESFGPDTMVTLTAVADAGSAFASWGGDCAAAGTTPTCLVTMTAAQDVTAQFDVNLQGLAVTVTGGGVVTSVPAGINCGADCTEAYVANTQVTLTATPNAGQVFTGWGGACAAQGVMPTCMLTINAGVSVTAGFEAFYLRPLTVDANCTTLLHFDTGTPLAQACGGGGPATLSGTYSSVASRTIALAQAYASGGATEEGWIDTQKLAVAPPSATVELTLRKTGAAYDARGAGVLYSDRGSPGGRGLRISVLDDGRLVASTRDGVGGTSTASTAPGVVADAAWHHVAVTVSATNGLRIFVDGAQSAQLAGALLWTNTSSTAWVGAEREQGAADAIYRFNGTLDEVRVSNVLRY